MAIFWIDKAIGVKSDSVGIDIQGLSLKVQSLDFANGATGVNESSIKTDFSGNIIISNPTEIDFYIAETHKFKVDSSGGSNV